MLRWQLCGLPLFCRHAGLCTRFPLEVTVLVESDDDFAMKIAEVLARGASGGRTVHLDSSKHTAYYTLCAPGEQER